MSLTGPITTLVFWRKIVTTRSDFVPSDRKASAKTVADIYKKRWAVELLFRWLKGHLDIRYLPTKTKNSVKTQLAVAVLVQLLLQLKKIIDGFPGTLWDSLRDIRVTFVRKILAGCGPPGDCRWNGTLEAELTS